MIEGFDALVLEFFQNIHTPVLDRIMVAVTNIGEMGMVWIVIAIPLLFSKKYRVWGIMVLASLLLGLIVGNGILKNVIGRARPCWVHPEVQLLVANPKDFSFPSGHTLSSFEAATVLMFANKKMGIPALFLAIVMAASRLYLYVHYPTDILGGIVLGIMIGCLTVYLFRTYRTKVE